MIYRPRNAFEQTVAGGNIESCNTNQYRDRGTADMQVLLFANGLANPGSMMQRALDRAGSAHILCADGGALNACKFGLMPQTIIGDLDSLTAEQGADFAASGVEIIAHPPDKDETDLELALLWCIERNATSVCIIGALGGRFDQTLANIYLLALPQLRDIPVEVVDAVQSIRLLQPGFHRIPGQAGDTISLIPLGASVDGITTEGLKYPLQAESLLLGPARGISNVIETMDASIEFEQGMLLIVHTCGRA